MAVNFEFEQQSYTQPVHLSRKGGYGWVRRRYSLAISLKTDDIWSVPNIFRNFRLLSLTAV